MRCVSYTRMTSCKGDGKIPADIIKQQDQHIQEYLKKQGWTLSAKYCDRKKDTEENTAFEELTKDGIDRKFDMVVIDSIDRCGRFCNNRNERNTFYCSGRIGKTESLCKSSRWRRAVYQSF